MSPETFTNLLRALAIVFLSARVSASDFTAPLSDTTFGDLQALVLLAGVIAGYK